jgi:hypothetical protein
MTYFLFAVHFKALRSTQYESLMLTPFVVAVVYDFNLHLSIRIGVKQNIIKFKRHEDFP